MPDTVLVEGNKLTVRKVDYAVNTTFTCEAKNKLGVSKLQITTIVIGESAGPTERPARARARTRGSTQTHTCVEVCTEPCSTQRRAYVF